eukprot:gene19888-19790_t
MTSLLLSALAMAALPASAEIVVIVSQKNPATRMFSEQASQFFLGKSNLFTPVDQPESSHIRAEFYQKIADKDPAQVKALWSKLVFTGKATPPKEYANSAELHACAGRHFRLDRGVPVLSLTLRAKFLLLSALIPTLVVGLLIWNSLRLMNNAVSANAERVAQEYAVALNLTLSPYATGGRLPQLRGHLAEMLADPADSYLRYLVILDERQQVILSVGQPPAQLPASLRNGGGTAFKGVRTELGDSLLHARAPLLLLNNHIGSINFGITTSDLKQARDEVMWQGGVISMAGLMLGMLLFYIVTQGIARRLNVLSRQSTRMVMGDYSNTLPEHGNDEITVFTRTLNTLSAALRERINQLEQSQQRLLESEERFKT